MDKITANQLQLNWHLLPFLSARWRVRLLVQELLGLYNLPIKKMDKIFLQICLEESFPTHYMTIINVYFNHMTR